jgi:hypothetical protein
MVTSLFLCLEKMDFSPDGHSHSRRAATPGRRERDGAGGIAERGKFDRGEGEAMPRQRGGEGHGTKERETIEIHTV